MCALAGQKSAQLVEHIARVRNCPDVTILNSLFGLCHLFFCPFVFLYFSLFFLDIMLIKCLKGLKSQKSLFVSELKSGSHPVTHSVTKVSYRAARAAKNSSPKSKSCERDQIYSQTLEFVSSEKGQHMQIKTITAKTLFHGVSFRNLFSTCSL